MAAASAEYMKDPFCHSPNFLGSVAAMTYSDYNGMVFPNSVPARSCLDCHSRLAFVNAEREEWADLKYRSAPMGQEESTGLELLSGKMHD